MGVVTIFCTIKTRINMLHSLKDTHINGVLTVFVGDLPFTTSKQRTMRFRPLRSPAVLAENKTILVTRNGYCSRVLFPFPALIIKCNGKIMLN